MSRVCQCCNGSGIEPPDDSDGAVEALRAECHAAGMAILPGDRVSLKDAARLLNIAYGTARNWRSERDMPRGEIEHGRVVYSLAEIVKLHANDNG